MMLIFFPSALLGGRECRKNIGGCSRVVSWHVADVVPISRKDIKDFKKPRICPNLKTLKPGCSFTTVT